MGKIVEIRGMQLGQGAPKIIVPIVGQSREDIVGAVKNFEGLPLDMVEWRADFYEHIFDTEQVLHTLAGLRAALGDKPLLFTFRTKKEGGEQDISPLDYTALNKTVAASGLADLLDVEIFSGDEVVRQNIDNIHDAKALVVGSSHDFQATPPLQELVARLRKMQDMEADIAKIAVMPTCRQDVLTLLSATLEMYENYADRPLITMSMAAQGLISRLAGEVFGSAASFGSVGRGSAPGQIPVQRLAQALEILHDAL